MSTKMDKKRKKKNIVNAGIAGASAEPIQRYGSAVKEHVVAHSGRDNEAVTHLKKSLKSISKEKVNPDYKNQNIRQQAGFSAEVKETARFNADNVIKGEARRKIRTDDLGRVNDPLYDHVEVDASRKIIPGSGSQMKFVGDSPKEAFEKLSSKKFAKYRDNNVKIEVPSNYYDGILLEADVEMTKLQKQMDDQLAKGNIDTANGLKKRIENCQEIKKNLRKSNVSTDEAIFARQHPKLSTAIDIGKVSHRAGLETAQTAGIISGSVSIVQNLVALAKGDIEAEDAVLNVAKDTGTSAVIGYGTGFAGSFIKGHMQNAGSETVRALSKTNLPGVIVTVTVSAAKSMKRYFSGEITGLECFEELGEQGAGMLASSLFSIIGQAAIPIPVIGGLIGGMIGYALSSASYKTLLNSLKEANLAHEERIRIEQECEEHISMIQAYRMELEKVISQYLKSNIEIFHCAFDNLKTSLAIGDVDGFIFGANAISEALNRTPQFENVDEFNAIMDSDTAFKL
jgi:hypothetical protein